MKIDTSYFDNEKYRLQAQNTKWILVGLLLAFVFIYTTTHKISEISLSISAMVLMLSLIKSKPSSIELTTDKLIFRNGDAILWSIDITKITDVKIEESGAGKILSSNLKQLLVYANNDSYSTNISRYKDSEVSQLVSELNKLTSR